jgi:hypothetical protein
MRVTVNDRLLDDSPCGVDTGAPGGDPNPKGGHRLGRRACHQPKPRTPARLQLKERS